jgi:diacylglycerol kinase family enzyme
VAVGGDGTINAVVNGFYDHVGHRLSDAKFGVIYTGTSPDFNKSYQISRNIEASAKLILNGATIPIRVGMISFEASDMPIRYFVCCSNIGLGARLARMANSGIRKKLGDFWGTFLSLLLLLINFKSITLVQQENGKENQLNKLINISIGITPYIASGIRVPVQFTNHGEEFYKMIVQNLNLWRMIPLLQKVYLGKPFKNGIFLSLDYCRHIRFSSPEQVEVEADGDPVGYLPCRIEFAKDDLYLIIPE